MNAARWYCPAGTLVGTVNVRDVFARLIEVNRGSDSCVLAPR
jgi:hypothetical protein